MNKLEEQNSRLLAEIDTLQLRIKGLEAESLELRQTRLLLKEEHAFRKAVIERAAEGVCVCHNIDAHPYVCFTLWNPRMQQITGYTMEEINHIGWYQSMYPDPEVQEKAKQRMLKMRDGDDLWYERWEIVRADGQPRVLGISTSVVSRNKDQVHVLALMHDATDEERYRRQLETRITSLEGLLPICTSCKKIRDDGGQWTDVEIYISEHSDARFTHGICPSCTKELYPDYRA